MDQHESGSSSRRPRLTTWQVTGWGLNRCPTWQRGPLTPSPIHTSAVPLTSSDPREPTLTASDSSDSSWHYLSTAGEKWTQTEGEIHWSRNFAHQRIRREKGQTQRPFGHLFESTSREQMTCDLSCKTATKKHFIPWLVLTFLQFWWGTVSE